MNIVSFRSSTNILTVYIYLVLLSFLKVSAVGVGSHTQTCTLVTPKPNFSPKSMLLKVRLNVCATLENHQVCPLKINKYVFVIFDILGQLPDLKLLTVFSFSVDSEHTTGFCPPVDFLQAPQDRCCLSPSFSNLHVFVCLKLG